ncbi:MAG: DUF565 domain-containing protein [Cyanobium sp.]
MAKPLPWTRPELAPAARLDGVAGRFQQTRFQRRIAQAISTLEAWAFNPWRRLSLLLIVLLSAMVVGGCLASITGAMAYLDPVAAVVTVLLLEAAVRLRGALRGRHGDRLQLQLLDMARIGLFYGLLLDGFKMM